MNNYKIVLWPNPILKRVSSIIREPAMWKDLAKSMTEVMLAHKGVGLSAIQVGIPIRLVTSTFCEPMTNPVITAWVSPKESVSEGCLSLPGYFEAVDRYPGIQVTYTSLEGIVVVKTFTELAAQCYQHEIEHLDGKFFLDHVKSARRDQIRSCLMKKGKTPH